MVPAMTIGPMRRDARSDGSEARLGCRDCGGMAVVGKSNDAEAEREAEGHEHCGFHFSKSLLRQRDGILMPHFRLV